MGHLTLWPLTIQATFILGEMVKEEDLGTIKRSERMLQGSLKNFEVSLLKTVKLARHHLLALLMTTSFTSGVLVLMEG